MTIQISIIKIESYGPWTLTLGADRESDLQMLQAQIYHDLQKFFSDKNCLVFFNRFDEYFALTNQLSVKEHINILKKFSKKHYNLKLSISIGTGKTPFAANIDAYNARTLHNLINRTFSIYGTLSPLDHNNNNDKNMKILHVDIDNSSHMASGLSPYEITSIIMKLYTRLIENFLQYDSLTFFLGGDNFMIVTPIDLKQQNVDIILKHISNDLNISLNCGIGIGTNGKNTAKAATLSLDTIRKLRKTGKIVNIFESKCI
ncbi:MAG: GTP cyclohydrolase IIa [Nitrososphaeraceae archaeon]